MAGVHKPESFDWDYLHENRRYIRNKRNGTVQEQWAWSPFTRFGRYQYVPLPDDWVIITKKEYDLRLAAYAALA